MPESLSRQLIAAHLVSGEMIPGSEITLTMDQALLQDVLLPLRFTDPHHVRLLRQDVTLCIEDMRDQLAKGRRIVAKAIGNGQPAMEMSFEHEMNPRQVDTMLAGGAINWMRQAAGAADMQAGRCQ